MTLQTRKPTGKPVWPVTLIAGAPKAGKSYAAAAACGSDLIDHALWIPIGEDDPDELAPLGDFEIVQHDGTVRGITHAVSDAVDHLAALDGTGLIVIDSLGRLWDLIGDDLQREANRRAAAKAAKYNRRAPDEDVSIGMDLWNLGKGRWYDVLDMLRGHRGPSIVTARMSLTTIMDASGQPTKDKDWKIGGQKDFENEVGAVVKMPARGETYLTGVRSLRKDIPRGVHEPVKDFTVDGLWRQMGLADDASARVHQGAAQRREEHAVPTAAGVAAKAAAATAPADVDALGRLAHQHGLLAVDVDGRTLNDVLLERMSQLQQGIPGQPGEAQGQGGAE